MENIKNEQLFIRNEMRTLNIKFDRYITRENSTQDNQMSWMEQYDIELPLKTVEKFEQLCSLMKDKNIKNKCVRNFSFICHCNCLSYY